MLPVSHSLLDWGISLLISHSLDILCLCASPFSLAVAGDANALLDLVVVGLDMLTSKGGAFSAAQEIF